MTNYADLLVNEPEKKKPQTDYADMLVNEPTSQKSMEPPVGGTFAAPEPGKPALVEYGNVGKAFVTPSGPEASAWTQAKASWADDPETKKEIFAKSRGIPLSRYRVGRDGHVEWMDESGKWNREVWELKSSKAKNIAAEVLSDPAFATSIAGGMMGGPLGAVAGAVIGKVGQKVTAKTVFHEKMNTAEDLIDVAAAGGLALGGEMTGKVIGYGVNRFLMRGAGVLRKGVPEATQGILSETERVKAEMLMGIARQYDIPLLPHQVYDKQGMTNLWKYLRQHPLTSDTVQILDKKLEKATADQVEKFIRQMGGYNRTAYGLGEEVEKTAEKVMRTAEDLRTRAVKKPYEKAFMQASEKGGVDLQPTISKLDDVIESYPDGPSKSVLQRVKKSLTFQEAPSEQVVTEAGPRVSGSTVKDTSPGGLNFDIRKWLNEHGKIAMTRDIRTGELKTPGLDMKALTRREGAAGVDKSWPFAKADSGEGQTFDVLFQELKAEGFSGTIDDAAEMLQNALTGKKGIASKTEQEIYDYFDKVADKELAPEMAKAAKEQIRRVPETDLRKIQKALFDINDLIEGVHPEAVNVAPSSKKTLERSLAEVKESILSQIKQVAPAFEKANLKYEKLSGPIDKLKSSVIGELTRLRSDASIAKGPHKLLDVQNMPDAELVKYARKQIESQSPDLWREIVGGYVRDTWESLLPTQAEGKVVNAAGKLHQKLFGGKQGEIMKAAMAGMPEAQVFDDLFGKLFPRVAIGGGKESMTAPFLQIEKQLSGPIMGKLQRFATSPKQTLVDATFGKWNDILMSGRQRELVAVLQRPDIVAQINALKPLTPGSQKLIDGFGVLTAYVAKELLQETP